MLGACTETGDVRVPPPMPVVEPPSTQSPAVEDEHFIGFALVRGGATLHTRPDPLAPGIDLPFRPYPQGMNRWASQSHAVVVGLQGVEGDYLRVDPFVSALGHCETTLGSYDEVQLSLYVARDAVEVVTARPVESRADDGTSIRLEAGVPLEPMSGGAWKARAFGVEVQLSLPPDAVGHAYWPSGPWVQPESTRRLPPDTVLEYGAQRVEGASYLFGGNEGAYVYDTAPTVEPRGWAVGVSNECISLRAWAVDVGPEDTTVVRDASAPRIPLDGVRPLPVLGRPGDDPPSDRWPFSARRGPRGPIVPGHPHDRYRVDERAVLSWFNGDPIGHAGAGLVLPDHLRFVDGRVCSEQTMPGGRDRLELCVAAEAVRGVLPRHAHAKPPGGLAPVQALVSAQTLEGWPILREAVDLERLQEFVQGQERADDVAHCYASALRYELVRGPIELEFRVVLDRSDDGVRATVWDYPDDRWLTLHDCVVSTIEHWTIPEVLKEDRQKLMLTLSMSPAVRP